ncbi:helix-turn-helix domain-containing protein [Nocardiopsis sp. NPDC050513]|uniref:AraC-like ligand-binding domain-containing protein n=1 Tax=Nocardiopsis sp. NPDC050513 TaxID=3364338 RepID=UPI0037B701CF
MADVPGTEKGERTVRGREGAVTARGADAWAQVISESFVPLSLGSVSDEFRGSVRPSDLGPALTLTDVRTHGHSVVARTARLVRTEPSDDCLFSLHLEGEGAVVQGGHEARLRPGGGALYDTARPYELRFPTGTRQLVLQIPRQHLSDRVGRVEDLCGRALPAGQASVRVLTACVKELADTGDRLTVAERAELGTVAVDLLASALRAGAGGDGPPDGRTALRLAMRAFVRDHLADPRLTPEALARQHGISVRYTAQLFAADGTSPAAFIRAERLRAAHRMLVDPRFAGFTVSALAARCGFTDRTTFTRAFVREFGLPPAALRAARSRSTRT